MTAIRAVWMLVLLLAAAATAALHDFEITSELEKALSEDYATLHFRHLKARARRGETPETLLAVDFPGSHDKFVVLLDRVGRKVLVESVAEGLTTSNSVSVPSLRENSTVKSLVLELQQKESTLTVDVRVDCDSHGQLAFPISFKKILESGTGEPRLHVFRERHHLLECAGGEQRAALLERLGCPVEAERMQGIQPQPASEDPNRHLPPLPPGRREPPRGDISIMHGCDECEQDLLAKTMSELIQALKRLREEVEFQRSETRHLREILEQCEICKPGTNYRQG